MWFGDGGKGGDGDERGGTGGCADHSSDKVNFNSGREIHIYYVICSLDSKFPRREYIRVAPSSGNTMNGSFFRKQANANKDLTSSCS